MNYLEMRFQKINEGAFKEIDKTLINPDDPDYIEKDRERMFNNLKAADAKKKMIAEVQSWMADHVAFEFNKLTPDLYLEYYEIEFKDDDLMFEHPIINLFSPAKYYGSSYSFAVKMAGPSDLPYKFGKCRAGHSFNLIYKGTEGAEPINQDILKNIPDFVSHNCFLDNLGLTSLSGLPAGLNVVNSLVLSNNNIESLVGMPDNIRVGELDLSHNKLHDLTGFNPSTKISENLNLSYNKNLESIKGLPNNYSLNNELDLSHCGIVSLKTIGWPKKLSVKKRITLTNNYLTFADFPEYPDLPFPRDLSTGCINFKYQQHPDILYHGSDFYDKCMQMYRDYPLVPGYSEYGDVVGIPYVYTPEGPFIYRYKVAYPKNIDSVWGSAFIAPESMVKDQMREYEKTENRSNLNEGLFKKIEQTIVNPDDPDYIEKDRERMFNNFKEKDEIAKTFTEIRKWIHEHIYYLDAYKSDKHILTGDDEGVLYNIDNTEKNFTINLTGHRSTRCMFCLHSLKDATTELFNDNGELPYKFGDCKGGFRIDYTVFSYNDMCKKPEEMKNHIRSLKNFPQHVSYDCILSIVANHNISSYIDLSESGLSGLPENFTVDGMFQLHTCNLKNFKGMPSNMHIKTFNISFNPIVNFYGWNPSAGVEIEKLEITYCTEFKSLSGLPDNYSFNGSLIIEDCKLQDIIDWPENLTIQGELSLKNNELTKTTIQHLPQSLKVENFLSCYGQYPREIYSSQKSPAVLPNGIMAVNGISYWIHMADYLQRLQNAEEDKQKRGRPSLNEGLFKDVERTIIDQDDPDYIKKDREKMFNQFKDKDLETMKIKKENEVIQWMADHMLFQGLKFTFEDLTDHNPWAKFKDYSGKKDPGSPADFYRIRFDRDDTDYEHPIIDLLFPEWAESWADITFRIGIEDGVGLPYKFGKCYGSFYLDGSMSTGCITTLENIPYFVRNNCVLADGHLTLGAQSKTKQMVKIENLSTLPLCFRANSLYLQRSGLKSLEGMPDNVSIYTLNLNYCNLTNLKGFNPTANITTIILSHNPQFNSIEGLPDNYTLENLNISYNAIDDIVNWPENLNVRGTINMIGNNITIDKFPEYPNCIFPLSLTALYGIDLRHQKVSEGKYGWIPGEWKDEKGCPKYIMPDGVTSIEGTKCVRKKDYFEAKESIRRSSDEEKENMVIAESLKDRSRTVRAILKSKSEPGNHEKI